MGGGGPAVMPCRGCVRLVRECRRAKNDYKRVRRERTELKEERDELKKRVTRLKERRDEFKRQLFQLAGYFGVEVEGDDIARQIVEAMDKREQQRRKREEEERLRLEVEATVKEVLVGGETDPEVLEREEKFKRDKEVAIAQLHTMYKEQTDELNKRETEVKEREARFRRNRTEAVKEFIEENKLNTEGECGISTQSELVADHQFNMEFKSAFEGGWTNKECYGHLMAVIKHRHQCNSCMRCAPQFRRLPQRNPSKLIGLSVKVLRRSTFYADAQDFKTFLRRNYYQRCCNQGGVLRMRDAIYFCGETYLHHMNCPTCRTCVVGLPQDDASSPGSSSPE